METGPISAVLQHVRRLAAVEAVDHLSDGQLLERFRANADEQAFAALLHRHGPMVWRVCQRVLQHRQNAEDVFQATFLTLFRKASAIRKQDSLACWLHGVAYRLARRARTEHARASAQNTPAASPPGGPVEQASGQELHAVLDEELSRLAERYRKPLLLCYLEGLTRDEAAEQLGWSLGTLKRRLDVGRKLLRERLTQRGVTLGATLFGAVLAGDLSAGVPPTLLNATWTAATLLGGGRALGEVVSAPVAALTYEMVTALAASKWKWAAAFTAALALAGGGLASSAWPRTAPPIVEVLPAEKQREHKAAAPAALSVPDKSESSKPPIQIDSPKSNPESTTPPVVSEMPAARPKEKDGDEEEDHGRKMRRRSGREREHEREDERERKKRKTEKRGYRDDD